MNGHEGTSHGDETVRRVVILTAGVGAGHDGPARELARRLNDRGHQVSIVDLVTIAPYGIGVMMRALFHVQLAVAPNSWGKLFQSMAESTGLPWLARTLIDTVSRRVANILVGSAGERPADVVVGTFPAAGHVVSASRRFGSTTPSVIYITDPAVHRLWTAEGTDLYLTTWHCGLPEVRRHTTAPVAIVAPAVRREFTDLTKTQLVDQRAALGLPSGPLALLSSGSWGVGDVRGAAADLLAYTGFAPVVVCGHNERLRRRLANIPGVVALGWVADMAALMRVCEVAVLNSGGLTLAETAAAGLPAIHYRPLPGQGEANAAVCESARCAGWPRSGAELAAAMSAAINDIPVELPSADPIGHILAVAAGTYRCQAQTGEQKSEAWQVEAA